MATALILAAGKATRLEGIRDRFAKANVPIGKTTPLRFMLERLAAAGVTHTWVNLHYLAEQVRSEALRWAPAGMKVDFLPEPQLLGTGGTLLRMLEVTGDLPDVVVNAKMFTDFDFEFVTQSTANEEGCLMVLHPPTALADFGGLTFDASLRITGLHTRTSPVPASPDAASAAVFTGIARPDAAWVPFLQQAASSDQGTPICSIRHGLLPALAAGTSSARAYLHHGYWKEISTPKRVAEIREEMPDLCG